MQSYDLKKMQNLLQDFYNLTNIKICIYDSEENELCYYPEKHTAFCKLLREDEDMDARCHICDRRAFAECKKTRKQYVYTCHAGLIECVSPIIYADNIIGYIVIGQIKANDRTHLPQSVKKSAEKLGPELYEQFENLPALDIQKINAAIHIMDACTGYEYLKALISSAERKIDTRISAYVGANLQNDLSVATLCSKFHLSHSEIYSIFKTYFNNTPADYVKKRRLDKACDYLVKTTYPVNKIAQLCGIPDYNYFSKTFKRAYNISPREYRKTQ